MGDTYVEQGATATDSSGVTLTPVITGTVDVNTEGTYTVTYTATDSSEMESVKTRTIIVSDPASEIVLFGIDTVERNNPYTGVPDFVPPYGLIVTKYTAYGLYSSNAYINLSLPFKLIVKMEFTEPKNQNYLDITLAKTTNSTIYQVHQPCLSIRGTTFYVTGLNVGTTSEIPLSFYDINVDRYIIVTYNIDNTTDVYLLNENTDVIWNVNITTHLDYSASRIYFGAYINNASYVLKGILSTNNTTRTVSNLNDQLD